jgi:hypothetical protein
MMYKTHLATSIALSSAIVSAVSYPFTISFLAGGHLAWPRSLKEGSVIEALHIRLAFGWPYYLSYYYLYLIHSH